jgi:dTDP-4-amino-4,6-dideoxygalactose transaminase
LRYLHQINEHKKLLASRYQALLDDRKFIKPWTIPNVDHVFHIYCVRHPKRDQLKQYLLDHDIKTEIHYPIPPHQQVALKSVFQNQVFPVSEEIHRSVLSLPLSFGHQEKDILRVIEVMNQFPYFLD